MMLVLFMSLYLKCDALLPEVEGPLYISVVLLLSLPTLLLRKENPLLLPAPSWLSEGALCCSRMGQLHLNCSLPARAVFCNSAQRQAQTNMKLSTFFGPSADSACKQLAQRHAAIA